jgi:hypothetical protein
VRPLEVMGEASCGAGETLSAKENRYLRFGYFEKPMVLSTTIWRVTSRKKCLIPVAISFPLLYVLLTSV